MKSITFTRKIIKTEEVFETVILNLEDNERYLELDDGVTIEDVICWSNSNNQKDQEKLNNFVWTNECYGDSISNEYGECYDAQLEEIYDIAETKKGDDYE